MTKPAWRFLFIALLLISALYASPPTLAGNAHVQFCWAMGTFDHTIYFAEAENREDRQVSFGQLLEISGIDHHALQCRVSDPQSLQAIRAGLFREWRESELEIVNTTFLSDLDY
jgi:hypothetical protein